MKLDDELQVSLAQTNPGMLLTILWWQMMQEIGKEWSKNPIGYWF